MEVGCARQVGVGVHLDVDAVVAGRVDQGEQLARAPAVAGEAEVGVREVQRGARAARDLDRVRVALDRVQPVVAVVRAVERAVGHSPQSATSSSSLAYIPGA